MIDNRGTTLEVGQEVAYNLSGQIAKGRILTLNKRHRSQWHTEAKIDIELLHDACGKKAGHISKIRHERNVLVLLDGEK